MGIVCMKMTHIILLKLESEERVVREKK